MEYLFSIFWCQEMELGSKIAAVVRLPSYIQFWKVWVGYAGVWWDWVLNAFTFAKPCFSEGFPSGGWRAMWSVPARNNFFILILSFLNPLCVCTYTKLNLNTTLYKNNFLYVKICGRWNTCYWTAQQCKQNIFNKYHSKCQLPVSSCIHCCSSLVEMQC